jgi:hypothetical protein
VHERAKGCGVHERARDWRDSPPPPPQGRGARGAERGGAAGSGLPQPRGLALLHGEARVTRQAFAASAGPPRKHVEGREGEGGRGREREKEKESRAPAGNAATGVLRGGRGRVLRGGRGRRPFLAGGTGGSGDAESPRWWAGACSEDAKVPEKAVRVKPVLREGIDRPCALNRIYHHVFVGSYSERSRIIILPWQKIPEISSRSNNKQKLHLRAIE